MSSFSALAKLALSLQAENAQLRASRDELVKALNGFIAIASAPPSASRTKMLKDHCDTALAALASSTDKPEQQTE
jgi:hypothetical protein